MEILNQAAKYAESKGYGKGRAYLEDDFFDDLDKQTGIDWLIRIGAIETEHISYQIIVQHLINSGDIYVFEFNGQTIYFVPN